MVPVAVPSRLRRPTAPRLAIARARLTQRLDQGLGHRLILVSAPAGYGKTTAVSQWLGHCPLPSAWVALDRDDTGIETVMAYITAAVEAVYPDACRATRALLQLPSPAPAPVIADRFTRDLCAIDGDLVLVLDDCHHVTDTGVYTILSRILRHSPPGLHLVIVTRFDPPMPLWELRAKDGMTELRPADLRFTSEETRQLLRQATGSAPDPATLAWLEERLEGWPVGLHLLLRALEGASGHATDVVRAMHGSVRTAADYLAAEMLSSVPAEVRRRLVETALLERFCAPLVDALCTEPSPDGAGDRPAESPSATTGAQFIDYLVARDLFIVPLDDEALWYRYHGALQAILRQYLAAERSEAARKALHQRAARWYDEHGHVDQALHHLSAAGDWASAAAVVQRARFAAVNHLDWGSLRRWLARLPSDVVARSPELLVVKAYVLQNAQQLPKVDELLAQAEALAQARECPLSADEQRVLAAEIAFIRSNSSYWRADVAGCVSAAQRALDLAPDQLSTARGASTMFLGLGLQMAGRADRAQALLRQALEHGSDEPVVYQTRLLLGLAAVAWASADLDGTLTATRRLAALSERHGLLASLGWANYLAGMVCLLRDDLAAARQHFTAIAARPYDAHPMVALQAHLALAAVHGMTGRRAEAADWANQGTAWALERGMPGAIELGEALRARLGLLTGQVAGAITWAESRPVPRWTVPLFMVEDPVLTWIQAQLARPGGAGAGAAAEALATHHEFCAAIHCSLLRIHLLALDALRLDAQGRRGAALEALRDALALAEPGRIVRPFIDLRPSLVPLLAALAARSEPDRYVHRVLAGSIGAPATAPTVSPRAAIGDGTLVDALTPRELEVLVLLAQRYSNREIAARLVVSPVTVKSHAHNIYNKLDARNRREAVARARDLGLLTGG